MIFTRFHGHASLQREFLELLWLLEKTLDGYPEQTRIFERILESDLFKANELPTVPEELRQGPKLPKRTAANQPNLL